MADAKIIHDDEIWKPVRGLEGRYEVSSLGRLRSLDMWKRNSIGRLHFYPGRDLNPAIYSNKYRMACFSVDGKQVRKLLHAAVCEAFHGPRPNGMLVAHNNGDMLDNRAGNLRWATPAENEADKLKHGTHNRGLRHNMVRLSEDDVREIRRRLLCGESTRSIAEDYPVTRHCISRIKKRQIWAWLD